MLAAPTISAPPAPTGSTALPLPAKLRGRLACPACRAPLAAHADGYACQGAAAHAFARTPDGIPLLLLDDERRALHGDLDAAALMQRDFHASGQQRVVHAVKRVLSSTLHLPISPAVTRVWNERKGMTTLVVGSGTKPSADDVVNLDIAPFRGVDVIGSALRLPFADASFELVHSAAVLEHVREPQTMIAEMHRVLAPGGHVYTEVPFLQHFHAYPNDFQRYTTKGLEQAFAAFDVVETGVCVGPSSALLAMIADWCELWTFSQHRLLNDLVRCIPLTLLWPLKFLDHVLRRNPRAHELASGVYVLARKRAQ